MEWIRQPWVHTHGRRGLTPTVVLYHRHAVHMVGDTVTVGYHPWLWYATLTGFCIIISFTVGYAAPKAHASPTAVVYHRYAVLCYATPMGFEWWWIRYPWVDTHGCGISPLRGSVFCHRHARGLTPTAVVCHPYEGRMVGDTLSVG